MKALMDRGNFRKLMERFSISAKEFRESGYNLPHLSPFYADLYQSLLFIANDLDFKVERLFLFRKKVSIFYPILISLGAICFITY